MKKILAFILSLILFLPTNLTEYEYTVPQIVYVASETSEEVPAENVGLEGDEEEITYVYMTKTGKRYHNGGCRSLYKSKIKLDLSKAKDFGLAPCMVCSPPY